MGDKLAEQGVPVQWNTELVDFTQHSDHVDVSLRQPDGSIRRLRAAWLAGCDGSRSPVREMSGIGFLGAPYDHTFFVADTEATGPMKSGELNVYLWKDGFHLFFPMRGKDRWRVIGILPQALRQKDNLTFEDVIPAISQEAGAALRFKECSWFSTYRIHHRAAEKFRDGRCFLLGDAAHVHSPMGAQGMNTGLQDAYNLAWKLALVVKGRAAPALLDSYAQERMPVAQQLLRTTDRAFQLVVSDSRLAGLVRSRIIAKVAARAMKVARLRTLAFRTISQIGIRYPESALSQDLARLPRGAPMAGDRFPWMTLRLQPGKAPEDLFATLDDTRFNLLVFGASPIPSELPVELSDLLNVHVVPRHPDNDAELARAGVPWPSVYLLRPNGHVGLCGAHFDVRAIRRYVSERLQLIRPVDAIKSAA
jgi:2-polyprenyl-6-methoxyphenol hydroxylase-like FAD-dependent oxidoreductase